MLLYKYLSMLFIELSTKSWAENWVPLHVLVIALHHTFPRQSTCVYCFVTINSGWFVVFLV